MQEVTQFNVTNIYLRIAWREWEMEVMQGDEDIIENFRRNRETGFRNFK
jgi:hypothetical protein